MLTPELSIEEQDFTHGKTILPPAALHYRFIFTPMQLLSKTMLPLAEEQCLFANRNPVSRVRTRIVVSGSVEALYVRNARKIRIRCPEIPNE